MADYVSSKVNAVMQIRGLCIEEEDVERQIVELNMMEKILDTSAWTAEDLDLVGDVRHSRLDRCALELDRHRLLGGDGFTGNLPNGMDDCPFWHCVSDAKSQATMCLFVHQGRFKNFVPEAVLANTGVGTTENIPGGNNQVHVAFPLVTLLYATFNVPIPERRSHDLWRSLQVYERAPSTRFESVFECLDVGRRGTGFKLDVHDLKYNLRHDIFEIYGVGDTSAYNNTRYRWDAQPVMPWLEVLKELVGYTKHVQSQLKVQPSFCPLCEVRKECGKVRDELLERVKKIHQEKLDRMVHMDWIKDTRGYDEVFGTRELRMSLLLQELGSMGDEHEEVFHMEV